MLVLVGYASAHGSTQGIAERVAERLREHGHRAEALPLSQAASAESYEAAVLGSAIHNGAWLPEAADYARRDISLLAGRPVWLFSVGLARVLGRWFEKHGKDPEEVLEFRAEAKPRGHHLFAGALQPDHLPPLGRVIYRLMRGRYGDFRDWAEVDDWAKGIAAELSATSSTNSTP